VPLNCASLFNEEVEGTFRLLREVKVVVIAKKVLDAGSWPVDEAFRWAFKRPGVDFMALRDLVGRGRAHS